MPPLNIQYAVVARGEVVLAENSTVSGNVNVIALRILEKLPQEDTRVSYTQERHMFHILVQDGITFLCMAEEAFGRRLPFAFLEDLRTRFMTSYSHACKEAVAYEFNTEFSKVMAQQMEYYSNNPQADTMNRVKGEILEVKNIMIDNIEKVLDRGERLDVLVDKTDHLQSEAFTFKRDARRLRQRLWWQNSRMWAILSSTLLVLLYIIVGLACGFTFKKC